ncbi:hypothetical protein MRX96_017430 [Rhipicephalus microplus]
MLTAVALPFPLKWRQPFQLLLRLADVDASVDLVAGNDSAAVRRSQLARNVSVVSQRNGCLFSRLGKLMPPSFAAGIASTCACAEPVRLFHAANPMEICPKTGTVFETC